MNKRAWGAQLGTDGNRPPALKAAEALCDRLIETASRSTGKRDGATIEVRLSDRERQAIVARLLSFTDPDCPDPLPIFDPMTSDERHALRAIIRPLDEAAAILHRRGEPGAARSLDRAKHQLFRIVRREEKPGPKPHVLDVAVLWLGWCWNKATGAWPKQSRSADGSSDSGPFSAWANEVLKNSHPSLGLSASIAGTPILQSIRRLSAEPEDSGGGRSMLGIWREP